MVKQPSLELTKWYLDCVSPSGHCFVGYSALLRWKKILLKYESGMLNRDNKTIRKTGVLRTSSPTVNQKTVSWYCRPLALRGEWRARGKTIDRVLLDDERATIRWECLQPASRVRLLNVRGEMFSGDGYVEKLKLSFRKWQLPIQQLRWGRFVSEQHNVVWIQWHGEHPLELIFHNDSQVSVEQITDDEIRFSGDSVLSFADRTALDPAVSGSRLSSAIPGLGQITPLGNLRIDESKWLSRATLKIGTGVESSAWAIHEVVNFRNS